MTEALLIVGVAAAVVFLAVLLIEGALRPGYDSTEFVGYEPNAMVTFRFSGSMPGEGSYLFESTPEGTRVTSTVEMQPRGISRLAKPLIAASLRRQMEANLPVLKDLLEGRAAH